MEAHEILGVPKDASEEQVRAAYKALVCVLNFHRCEFLDIDLPSTLCRRWNGIQTANYKTENKQQANS